jgi:hypothetical protein
MKRFFQAFGLIAVTLISFAWGFAAEAAKAPAAAPVILPKLFGGWEKASSQASADPAAADPVNANVLKEYGFASFERAVYKRSDNRQITIRAACFDNAGGAYGAFTFYRLPEMLQEEFGDQGASFNQRILFYRGNILVEAQLDRVTAMTAAELRELSGDLILPGGPERNAPSLPQYLPQQAYVKNSVKYALGPGALIAAGSPLPVDLVQFGGRSAEVAEGKYSTSRGTATLMLIEYPTPQIAAERSRAFAALNQNPPPATDVTLAAPFTIKRSGPIVVLLAGQISSGEARSLLASVNYDADVTWNENTFVDKKNNVANLLVNIIFLIAILLGVALLIGVFFAVFRLTVKRFFPGRVFDRPEDMELLQLKLGSRPPER